MNSKLRNQVPFILAVILSVGCVVALGVFQKNQFDSTIATMPEGEGRLEFLANCTSCHGPEQVIAPKREFKDWDEAVLWMQKMQGMGPMPAKEHQLVLRYLNTNYPWSSSAEDSDPNPSN